MSRNTTTGKVLEEMVLPALERGGYDWEKQVDVGGRLGYTKQYRIDILATDALERQYLIELKWQQTQGTAENKIPFEVMCLAHARATNERIYKAYLVLGGTGWKYKEFYTAGGLNHHPRNPELVEIVALEEFVGLANAGRL